MKIVIPIANAQHMQVGVCTILRLPDGWYQLTIEDGTALVMVYVSPSDGRIAFCDREASHG